MSNRTPLSNIQQELLKLYSRDIPDEDLLAIKQIMAEYFARKAEARMEELWDEKGLTAEEMEAWAKEHNRTHQ
jgi:hypothetical protein